MAFGLIFKFFIGYAITVVPFPPSPSPQGTFHSHTHCSPCPWVIHTCSWADLHLLSAGPLLFEVAHTSALITWVSCAIESNCNFQPDSVKQLKNILIAQTAMCPLLPFANTVSRMWLSSSRNQSARGTSILLGKKHNWKRSYKGHRLGKVAEPGDQHSILDIR